MGTTNRAGRKIKNKTIGLAQLEQNLPTNNEHWNVIKFVEITTMNSNKSLTLAAAWLSSSFCSTNRPQGN